MADSQNIQRTSEAGQHINGSSASTISMNSSQQQQQSEAAAAAATTTPSTGNQTSGMSSSGSRNVPVRGFSPVRESYWFAGTSAANDCSNVNVDRTRNRQNVNSLSVNDAGSLPQTLTSPMIGERIIVPIYDDTNQNKPDESLQESYWFARGLDKKSSKHADINEENGSDGKDVSASNRVREERVRQAREKHDEERIKKIDDIKQASLAHQRYRGQLEEQRKRRIDDVRTRDNERQSAVLERRRQILEAEMDRREALLCRKLEREAKLEAKKNAQRNSMSFAFGSGSTPRLYESYGMSNSESTVNLVLPANVNTTPTSRRSASLNRNFNDCFSNGVNFGASTESVPFGSVTVDPSPITAVSSTMQGVPFENQPAGIGRGRRCVENHSADNLIGPCLFVAEDLMTKSCTSLPSSSFFGRGRRKTDLTPTLPKDKINHAVTPQTRPSRGAAMRGAISMSRLDQLAQPRRRRLLPSTPMSSSSIKNDSPSAKSKSRSMCNIAFGHSLVPTKPRTPKTTTSSVANNARTPTCKRPSSLLSSNLTKSVSMVHLSSSCTPPRSTKASKMRAEALLQAKDKVKTKSMLQLNRTSTIDVRATVRKTNGDSPRPKSSMSEHSTGSSHASSMSVKMRSSTPHRPRPLSVHGSTVPVDLKQRMHRSVERGSASKPMRAKSATNTDKTHEQDVSTAKQAPQKEKMKPKPAVAKKQEMKPIKSKTPSKSPSPDLHFEVQASDYNVNVMASKPDIVPDETLVNAPATDQPFAQDDKSLLPNHDKMSPPSLLEQTSSGKQKITSEEEAKVALAERRRQAREHAELEAEKERLRLEELEHKEEERIKKEEEEARKAELEQIRLAEEHRQLEEEKLLKAIEDKEKKDEEEQKIKEEEARQKVEKEVADRLVREEAERQRKENEEKLKREEEERALRRQKVAAIMKRTRDRPGHNVGDNQNNENASEMSSSGTVSPSTDVCIDANVAAKNIANNNKTMEILTSVDRSLQLNSSPVNNSRVNEDEVSVSKTVDLPAQNVDSPQPSSLDSSSSVNTVIFNMADNNSDQDSLSSFKEERQTNGHHTDLATENECRDDHVCATVNLMDLDSSSPSASSTTDTGSVLVSPQNSQEVEQLIDLNLVPTMNNKNRLENNVDRYMIDENDLNSNLNETSTTNPFIAFEDNGAHLSAKQQENSVADLLT